MIRSLSPEEIAEQLPLYSKLLKSVAAEKVDDPKEGAAITPRVASANPTLSQ
jgi:hypothetical protein